MKEIYLQQGDVILYKEKSIPKNAKKIEITLNNFVLEKGEGVNTHQLQAKNGRLQKQLLMYETEEEYIFNTGLNGLILVHEEHGTSELEPNILLSKVKEREYDYETQEARAVLD